MQCTVCTAHCILYIIQCTQLTVHLSVWCFPSMHHSDRLGSHLGVVVVVMVGVVLVVVDDNDDIKV